MQINLIAVGNRMPTWVKQGYQEYARRMPRECNLALKEIEPAHRRKNCDWNRLLKQEGERMLSAIPSNSHVVALDLAGKIWSTDELSVAISRWRISAKQVSLLLGGPGGLADACRLRANETWSLSELTFPHPLVRIIVAEQLYRAWTILCNHPYHK